MPSSNGRHVLRTRARTVVIMGADSPADIRAIAEAVAGQRADLVILATGWPLTEGQQRIIHEGAHAAAGLRLPFEARLVYTEADVKDHLLPEDTVALPGTFVEAITGRPRPSFA